LREIACTGYWFRIPPPVEISVALRFPLGARCRFRHEIRRALVPCLTTSAGRAALDHAPHAARSTQGDDLNPRYRRLVSDHRQLMTAFAEDPAVQITPVGPVPPERYRITYSLPSLRLTQHGQVVRVEETTVNILLPAGYPRDKPYVTTTEPVFHPNFGPHVCIADYWVPGHSLVDLVVEIADLLQFRRYSTKGPINQVAAQWAHENASRFPLGSVEPRQVATPTGAQAPDPIAAGPTMPPAQEMTS